MTDLILTGWPCDWTESCIIVFENIYWNQQREATNLQGIVKLIASFMTEKLHVSLKISWKNHSIKMFHFPSECSHSKKARILTIIYPVAAVRFSLQSLSAERLMPGSVTRIPLLKFRSFFVLFISLDIFSLDSLRALCVLISTICWRMGSGSLKFSNWEKFSHFTSLKDHSSYTLVGLRAKVFQSRSIRED